MSNEFKFFCEKCNYGTNKKMSMVVHVNTSLHLIGKHGRSLVKKLDKKKYECSICQTNYSSKGNLLMHNLNNHSTKEEKKKGYKFYCDICNIGYMNSSKYNHHLTTSSHQNVQSILTEHLQNINLLSVANSSNNNDQVNV